MKMKVYIPRAVAFTNATHEGGGGILASPKFALRMGGKNLRMGPQGHLVADWPQEFWAAAAGPACPCGAHTCAGRPPGGYAPAVRR